jgi:hypothetical protein
MIKIFEDEEEQPKNPGTKAAFSLDLDPVDTGRPEEPPVEQAPTPEPVVETTPVEEAPTAASSPWERIEEPPVFNAPESVESRLTMANAVDIDPKFSEPVTEPALFIEDAPPEPEIFVKAPYQPDTSDETIHNSGLAWSAGIIFFGSVVFMMLLGWGFDLLFGSSPYGLVGGIVFGSLIGFIQFFRISSQIFRK